MGMLKRKIEFRPAFDKRHSDPNKNYGIHGVDMKFILSGRKGTVVFVLFTGWQLPHVEKEFEEKGLKSGVEYRCSRPLPADLGYHSIKRLNEYDTQLQNCNYVRTGKCYYDGSSLSAEKPFNILVEQGLEKLWEFLEDYYVSVFDKMTKIKR